MTPTGTPSNQSAIPRIIISLTQSDSSHGNTDRHPWLPDCNILAIQVPERTYEKVRDVSCGL